jgi:hypothetical protein
MSTLATLASLVASLAWTSYVAFAMFFPPLRSTESLIASVSQQNHMFPKAWRSIPFAM